MPDRNESSDWKLYVPDNDPGLSVFGGLIRESDIEAFCRAKFVDPLCSACSRDSYVISLYSPDTDRGTVIVSATFMEDSSGDPEVTLNTDNFMPVFYLFCERCGHVRHHLLSRVKVWMDDGAPKDVS